ncbi:MAG: aminopeptidase P family protein [Deinococcus sp.]|nr:aminopeptidase P family protein [Deinococcus sp.]
MKEIQKYLKTNHLDGWLLYDFRGQNPTALLALGAAKRMLTRRWFYFVPASGQPVLLAHAIEHDNFPALPGKKVTYAGWELLQKRLTELLMGSKRLAMEYCPMGTIPYLSRVDAGTIELVRSYGVEVVSSSDLVQYFLCRWTPDQVESHRRAAQAINAAKDGAYEFIGQEVQRGHTPLETEVQDFLMARFHDAGLITDHPPIVAVGPHAGNPHYSPSTTTPTPIKKDDLVLIDLWAKENDPLAVYADITWTGYVGQQPPERYGEVFNIVARARDLGLNYLAQEHRAGRTLKGFEVDRKVRDYIAAAGYGPYFIHRTGHSIGAHAVHGDGANLDDLETHDERELVKGLGFSIEPGIYLPDFGIRSEIDVFLDSDGPKVFTPIQQEIVAIF